jgi:biopolymer transport protein ExbD
MKGMKLPDAAHMHPNVTPLIDVVMCLIIFYMLVARIGVDVGDIPMNLPYSQWGSKIEDMGNTVTLNADVAQVKVMSRDGKKMNEFPIPEPGRPRNDASEALKQFLAEWREVNPDVKVIIRADSNLEYRHVEPLLVACALAKMKNFNFATRDER